MQTSLAIAYMRISIHIIHSFLPGSLTGGPFFIHQLHNHLGSSTKQRLNSAVVPLPSSDILILARRSISDELLQGQQRSVAVGLGKVGDRVSLRDNTLVTGLDGGRVCDAVAGGLEGVVGQALERVADVEDDVGGR